MAIIKNVDKLRIREIEENLANDKVLTIDSTGLVAWKNQDEITPDLSAYYTKSEIDALLENISYNDLLDVPTNLSDFNNDEGFITISDVPSYTSGDGIDITNNEIRIKQSVLDEINANTNKTLSDVTSEGNTTNVKMIGSEVFSNTMKEDFAQIKDVNDSGWGLLPLQSEMKIGLVAKDGTTVLSSIDVSWLASGDLAVSIDDTDPQNPELVFSQGGVEVARIPASTLLAGVVRGGGLSDYILQFKDGNNTVLFDIDLENLFDQHYTKTEADGRFALRTRTITGTGGLTGGGNLTANRTIALSTTTQNDIAKGVTAHGWGDFRDYGLGVSDSNKVSVNSIDSTDILSGLYSLNSALTGMGSSGLLEVGYSGAPNYITQKLQLINSENIVRYLIRHYKKPSEEWTPWREVWHDGNLPNPATETWVNNQGFVTTDTTYTATNGITINSNNVISPIYGTSANTIAQGNHTHTFASLTNKPTTISGYGITDFNSLGDARWALRTRTITGTGSLTGGGDLTDDRTIDLTNTAKSDIAKGVTANGWGDFRDYGLGTEAVPKSGLLEDNNESGFYAFATSQQGFIFPRAIMLHRGSQNYGIIFSNSRDKVGFLTGDGSVYTAWHTGNLTNLSQLNNDLGNYGNWITKSQGDTYYSAIGHTHTFASLTSKPTTISGYGITDFDSLGDARWARRTRTITGIGSLTGGGDLTDDRTIDLSSTTKNDISKGLEAYDISNKAILTEMVSGNTSTIKAPDLNNIPNGSYTIGLSQNSTNSPFSVPRSLIRFGGNVESLLTDIVASPNSIAFRNVGNNTWRELWHTNNLSNPATETWVNSQGFIKDLSNYYTKNEANSRFVRTTGVQNISDTKTFLASPVVPPPTLDAHAVNKGWVEDEINGIQGELETFLVGSDGGRLSLGVSIYHILGKKIDVISGGGIITAPQDLNQILSGDLSIEIDEIPGLQLLAKTSVTLNRFRVGTVFREDVRADTSANTYRFIELRQGAVTSNPLTSSIFPTGVKVIHIKFHISGIIIT